MNRAATCGQEDVNRAVYSSDRIYRFYLHRGLTPAESVCLSKYRPHIEGHDVLDVGVGAGRTVPYLAPLAHRYEAVDYSPAMVEYVRRNLPDVSVRQADFRDLSAFDDGSFDFLFATDNVIDALSHEGRLCALRECARVLRGGGILAFSSHNLRYKRAFSPPWMDWSVNPLRMAKNLVRYGQSWRNYLRLAPMRESHDDYAVLNDRGHFYGCLHYYCARSTVGAQLSTCGFGLLEAIAPDGRAVPEDQDDREYPALLYVARR